MSTDRDSGPNWTGASASVRSQSKVMTAAKAKVADKPLPCIQRLRKT